MHLELMRDRSKIFPEVAGKEAVRTARIWHCGYVTLKPVAQLRNLEVLVVATFPDSSLDFLAELKNLRYLFIAHLPKVTCLDPLAKLEKVEALSLETSPSWDASGKCTIVESLAPIAKMPALKYLNLFGVRPANNSLADLEKCPNLQAARFSQYPDAEIKRFFEKTGVANQYVPEPRFADC